MKVAEPVASSVVPSQAPKPAPSDRMAALRRAKDAITQQQHSALPSSLRVLSTIQAPSASQILRCSLHHSFNRPILLFYFLPSRAIQLQSYTHNPNSYKTNALPTPPPPPSIVMENSLMATMMRSSAGASATPSRWKDCQQQPPPPRRMQEVV